jgi:opacity protein-like surface antigen
MHKSTWGFVAFAMLLASPPAGAADLTPLPAVSPPSYNWTGLYAGGHIGGAWDHRDVTISNAATGAALVSGTTSANSFIGGGQIGYNYLLTPHALLGIEADVSGASLRNSVFSVNLFGQRDNKLDVFGTVRGRLGYVWNNWLIYGTGGFAWADEQMTRTQLAGTVNNALPGTAETASGVATGWAAGAGVEWGLAGNWTARLEYLHLELGTQSFLFPLAAQRIDAKVAIDSARLGFNYRFDWGTPVVARY